MPKFLEEDKTSWTYEILLKFESWSDPNPPCEDISPSTGECAKRREVEGNCSRTVEARGTHPEVHYRVLIWKFLT